jgi:hypothetical protein
VGGEEVPAILRYVTRSNLSVGFLVTSRPLDSSVTYRLEVTGVMDEAGNALDTSNAAVEFPVLSRPDTGKPGFTLAGIRDSVRDVDPWEPLDLAFTEPVLPVPARGGISFVDSAGAPVRHSATWLTPADLRLQPATPLLSKAWYTILVRLDSLSDYQGNRGRDSTVRIRFQTEDLKTTGTVEGVVTDAHRGDTASIYLTVRSIDLNPARRREIRMSRPGPFAVDRLREGRYVFEAFRDRDGSGTYGFGSPFPFLPSERFTVSRDTVKVRARWSVEGVTVKFGR